MSDPKQEHEKVQPSGDPHVEDTSAPPAGSGVSSTAVLQERAAAEASEDNILVDVDPQSVETLRAQGKTVVDSEDIELMDVDSQGKEYNGAAVDQDFIPEGKNPYPSPDDPSLNLVEKFLLRWKIRLHNLGFLLWWLFWASCRFTYHQDKTKTSFDDRNLFLNRRISDLAKATFAFLVLYAILAGLYAVALYCLSWGMWGNPQFDLNDYSWIPAGNPNSPN